MKRLNLSRISGYLSVVLAGLYSTAALLLPPFFGQPNVDFLFSAPVLISYWGGVATLFLAYIVDAFEAAERTADILTTREFYGVETFHHAKDFLERLADISVGAETVCTLNFSPPEGSSIHLDEYFHKIHRYLSSPTNLKSFRSVASIENPTKAQAIIERAAKFKDNPRVSFACFEQGSVARLMCYHVVEKGGIGYVFFYPPVALTGVMDAFLIINRDVANLMKGQFDLTWRSSRPILTGGLPNKLGVEFLGKSGAIIDSAAYKALYSDAATIEY